MKAKQELDCNTTSLEKEFVFEASKDIKIVTKVIYNEKDLIIERLIKDIAVLHHRIDSLKNNKHLVSEDTLNDLWDNEYDEHWNQL